MTEILQQTRRGLYCPAGDFYVDPYRPVDRAVVTHAHSDHARPGCRKYLAARASEHLLGLRLGSDAQFEFLDYGCSITVGKARVSFVPAGHMLGSAQVRVEVDGRVAVVTGDYSLGENPTCQPWEAVRCDLLVTESTFGLPVYRWRPETETIDAINRWWRDNRETGKCSLLYGYAIGKSQRLLAGLDDQIGSIFTHGAVEKGIQAYRQSGVRLPETTSVSATDRDQDWSGAMVLAVPSAHGTPWLRRFGAIRTAMASGWMAVRGTRRRRNVDRGFAISDHVDWPSLMIAIEACDPETVWVTHGYSAAVARYLCEQGRDAKPLETPGRSDEDEETQ